MANCPECSFEIELDSSTEPGEIILCDNCGADLVVAGTDPFALEPFEEEEK